MNKKLIDPVKNREEYMRLIGKNMTIIATNHRKELNKDTNIHNKRNYIFL